MDSVRESKLNCVGWCFGAAALGALATFFFDRVQGRRRRSLLRDQLVSASRDVDRAVFRYSRHFRNVWRGRLHRWATTLRNGDAYVEPEILVGRVRSEMGRLTRHPGAIEVTAKDGRVTLRGPILAGEAAELLAHVRNVRGVREVIDQLNLHEPPSHTPSLQGEGKSYLNP